MTKEIIEAVRVIEKEKGIDGETLIHALEDALLAAYKNACTRSSCRRTSRSA
jgi:hypothetical protein